VFRHFSGKILLTGHFGGLKLAIGNLFFMDYGALR
jgi:hypothetical protein